MAGRFAHFGVASTVFPIDNAITSSPVRNIRHIPNYYDLGNGVRSASVFARLRYHY